MIINNGNKLSELMNYTRSLTSRTGAKYILKSSTIHIKLQIMKPSLIFFYRDYSILYWTIRISNSY